MTDDVQEVRVGEVLEDESHQIRIGVLERLLVADPKKFGFCLGRQERGSGFHEPLLDGQEVLARTSLPAEQVSAAFQGVTKTAVRIPRMGLKRLIVGELVEGPNDVRFVGNENLRVQVQKSDQM